MIYYFQILHPRGTPIYTYYDEHKAPMDLHRFVIKKLRELSAREILVPREALNAAIGGLITSMRMFGDEFSEKLQRIEYAYIQIVLTPVTIADNIYWIVAIADIEDPPGAIKRILMNYVRRNKRDIERLSKAALGDLRDAPIGEEYHMLIHKLNQNAENMLRDRVRKYKILQNKDFTAMLAGIIVGITAFLGIIIGVNTINQSFHLIALTDSETILNLILVAIFAPAILTGLTIGYRRGALIGGFVAGIVGMIIISIIYMNYLIVIVDYLNLSPIGAISGVSLATFLLAAVFSLISFAVSYGIDLTTLVAGKQTFAEARINTVGDLIKAIKEKFSKREEESPISAEK
ncbi:MAG: hypothetical protein Q6351_001135 [Candidatus Njordarchaeum guaymaensis]